MIVRPARLEDAAACQAVYGHHVLHGVGTFEDPPPTVEAMTERMAAVRGRGLPWLAAEEGGKLLGFAYAAPFRLRAAYGHTVEDAVYVAPDALRRGVGRALLGSLVKGCEAARLDLRQMVALVGDSGNAASIGLHEALGFHRAGLFAGVGRKHDRWLDVVMMQRPLKERAEEPPRGPGLDLGGA